MQAYDETRRNIVLSDKSHHSSPRPFRATAGSAAFAAIPDSPESGSTGLVQRTAAANFTFSLTVFRAGPISAARRLADTRQV